MFSITNKPTEMPVAILFPSCFSSLKMFTISFFTFWILKFGKACLDFNTISFTVWANYLFYVEMNQLIFFFSQVRKSRWNFVFIPIIHPYETNYSLKSIFPCLIFWRKSSIGSWWFPNLLLGASYPMFITICSLCTSFLSFSFY